MFIRRMILVAVLSSLTLSLGCDAGLYTLPDPPPEEKRGDAELVPGEEERQSEKAYLAARAAIYDLHNLLSTQRYREAAERMSLETRDFLMHGSGADHVAEVLSAGEMTLPAGEVVEFDPVTMLLAQDVTTLKDSLDGVEEHETDSRKELFAVQPDGSVQKIVVIKEGGKWKLHRTRIPEPIQPKS